MTDNEQINFSEIFTFRNGKTRPKSEGKYKVYGSGGIIGTCADTNIDGNVSVIGRVGAKCGNVFFVQDPSYVSDNAIIAKTKENFDPYYGYYVLKNKKLNRLSHGSGQPLINQDTLNGLSTPSLSKQQELSCAELLSSIDKKIELNKKKNKTLEEIAKTLFKSWFIDFDLVRAKAEGRPTGLSKEISDLFPDSFEDSELGEIPKGWQIIRLKDLAKEVGKKIKKGRETKEKPYVPIDEISSEQLFLSQYKSGDEANSSLVSFLKDDILFGAMRPYFHKVCIAPFDGTTRTTCLVLNSIDKCYSSFLIFFLFQKSTIDYATQNSTGSTMPYIKWQNYLENLKLCLPPKEIGLEFKEFTSPILKKFQQHIFETRNLSNMRDTLLPKLISGELKILDAENLIEGTGI